MSSCTESLLRYLVGGHCHLEGIEGEQRSSALRPKELFNRSWIADFTYIWTAEGWLYVAAVVDLFAARSGQTAIIAEARFEARPPYSGRKDAGQVTDKDPRG